MSPHHGPHAVVPTSLPSVPALPIYLRLTNWAVLLTAVASGLWAIRYIWVLLVQLLSFSSPSLANWLTTAVVTLLLLVLGLCGFITFVVVNQAKSQAVLWVWVNFAAWSLFGLVSIALVEFSPGFYPSYTEGYLLLAAIILSGGLGVMVLTKQKTVFVLTTDQTELNI